MCTISFPKKIRGLLFNFSITSMPSESLHISAKLEPADFEKLLQEKVFEVSELNGMEVAHLTYGDLETTFYTDNDGTPTNRVYLYSASHLLHEL